MHTLLRIKLFAVFALCCHTITAQVDTVSLARAILSQRGEIWFDFRITGDHPLREISRMVSIDRFDGMHIRAWANREQFEKFLLLGIPFSLTDGYDSKSITAAGHVPFGAPDWNSYPGWNQYDSVMKRFADSYPHLCWLVSIAKSKNGKDLYFVKISDDPGSDQTKPEFMYSSSMHGDELTGYVLMIRLVDHLLTSYGQDPLVTKLIDSMEIWINPLANPDGAYPLTDTAIYLPKRGNANNIDLNRNFPDPAEGAHPDGQPYQPETQAMMDFFRERNFCMSANFHGGEEVLNYPWDTWYPGAPDFKPHADKAWFEYVCSEFVDTARTYSSPDYYSSIHPSGIINGADWYPIAGGRQDYVTYFCGGREVTAEISLGKMPPASSLPAYWESNYRSLLCYMEQALFGVRGFVTDSLTGKPVAASISIEGHDRENSSVRSDPVHGFFTRLLAQGSYSFRFSAQGYVTRIIPGVEVVNRQTARLAVELVPEDTGLNEILPDRISCYPNPVTDLLVLETKSGDPEIHFYRLSSVTGQPVRSERFAPVSRKRISFRGLPRGIYFLEVHDSHGIVLVKIVKTE